MNSATQTLTGHQAIREMQRRHQESKPYLLAADIVSCRLQVADSLEGMQKAIRIRQYLNTAYRNILLRPYSFSAR